MEKDNRNNGVLLQVETTCGSLLYELQIIWNEVGETEADRDKMLLELERECLEVYKRKVDQANRCRAQLRQAIADSEAELAAISSAMGERPVHIRQADQKIESLKEELSAILPALEEMRKRKSERKNQFLDVIRQIHKISAEIYGSSGYDNSSMIAVDENDLSLRKLEEFQIQLQSLQKEKNDRLKQVMEHLSVLGSLCSVLGLEFNETMKEVHPSLGDCEETYSISTDTLQRLNVSVKRLTELKVQRMKRIQDLGTMLLELWNLMDTPVEEQQPFQNVTCKIAASEDEITEPNMVSEEYIRFVEAEVYRLEALKSSKMKELVLKKRLELEDICRKTHMVLETDGETEYLVAAIESGALDPGSVLEQIELQVAKVKEAAFSRKEILEKVEKWLSAREEEEWLEEYNMDENRYNAGRGAHLTLKRAEKARALVNKLPGMVEALAGKVLNWEKERGVEFMYDGIRLLSMLEEYVVFRQEKEHEKKRQREQKKLQGQLMTEQEALFGSKPSPLKSGKKSRRMSMGGTNNRRLSVGGCMLQTPRPEPPLSARATPNPRPKKDAKTEAPSTVRRGLEIGGLPLQNCPFTGRESEPPMTRKPFALISSTASSRANAELLEDQNISSQSDLMQKTAPSKNDTPQKLVTSSNALVTATPKMIAASDENQIVPLTPSSTISMPMQMLITPGPAKAEEGGEEIEYSFEERRAGFVLPTTPLRRALHV